MPGTKWLAFPWKLLGPTFAKRKVTVRNWPEGIPMPPMAVPKCIVSSKPTGQTELGNRVVNAKSIHHLSHEALDTLASAILDPHYPLHFTYKNNGTSGESLSLYNNVWPGINSFSMVC